MKQTSTALSCPPPTAHRSLLSWHGWQLALPEDWSPVKIEGDWNKGSILIADFHATRLALRWQAAPKRKFDADAWTKQAIRNEVGELMLKKSVEHVPMPKSECRMMNDESHSALTIPHSSFSSGRLFLEPEPPGRDVWVGQSSVSNRLIEIVYQTKVRSNVVRDQILPELSDQPATEDQHWSIFDLSVTVPNGWTLKSQRLNAGDLTLSFGKKNEVLIVRQIAPAALALARQPLSAWLSAQGKLWKKLYRAKGEPSLTKREPILARDKSVLTNADPASVSQNANDAGHSDMTVLAQPMTRRRRFFLVRWVAKQRFTLAAHDKRRDRLVFVDASSLELATQTLATVGATFRTEET